MRESREETKIRVETVDEELKEHPAEESANHTSEEEDLGLILDDITREKNKEV